MADTDKETATAIADYYDALKGRGLTEPLLHELTTIHARGIANRPQG